jgi:glycosyltransferase involved in cell wall biosynthesis
MNNLPLISVIITTFNRVELLSLTLNSILGQTYVNIEVIVVSDGSTDGTDEFMKSLNDSRVCYLKLEENSGLPAVTRNHGIKNCNGDFIAFCDDDDIWDLRKLEFQFTKIDKYDLCFTNRKFIDKSGNSLEFRPIYIPHIFSIFALLLTNYITLSSVLVRKEILDKFNGFNETNEFRASEDYELWARMLIKKVKIAYCSEKLIYYRVHSNNISKNLQSGIIRLMKINWVLFKTENLSWYYLTVATITNLCKLIYYSLKAKLNGI